jgi:hypothetical protein
MTEGTGSSPQRKNTPGSSARSGLLVLGVLLLAVLVVFVLIYQQGLVPDFLLRPTLTLAETTPEATGLPDTTPPGYTSLVETLTAGPLAQTQTVEAAQEEMPVAEDTLLPPTPSMPSPTPSFGSCQYTLKSGPSDFLYAIYWNWHINNAIQDVDEYYTRIYCAALQENIECDYHSGDPDTILPGWILVLPGVTANICTFHGGTPVP